jgi:hypothetical protein
VVYQTRVDVGESEIYSDCDGITRLRFKASSTTATNSLFTVERLYAVSIDPYCKIVIPEEPTCTWDVNVRRSMCDHKWSAYRSSMKAIPSGLNEFDFYQQTIAGLPHISDCAINSQCLVDLGGEVVLIYWPPELTSRDICAAEGKGKASTVNRMGRPSIVTMDAITFKGQDRILLGHLGH